VLCEHSWIRGEADSRHIRNQEQEERRQEQMRLPGV